MDRRRVFSVSSWGLLRTCVNRRGESRFISHTWFLALTYLRAILLYFVDVIRLTWLHVVREPSTTIKGNSVCQIRWQRGMNEFLCLQYVPSSHLQSFHYYCLC